MRKIGFVLALTLMGATAASAQGIQLQLGGSDPDRGWDRAPRERVIVRERRGGDWDEGRAVRRREIDTTGSVGCRTTVVRRENDRGQMVTRRIRECD